MKFFIAIIALITVPIWILSYLLMREGGLEGAIDDVYSLLWGHR